MTVSELIEELQGMPGDSIATNSDGFEIDSVEESVDDDGEVILFTEDDPDDDGEPAPIDVPFKVVA